MAPHNFGAVVALALSHTADATMSFDGFVQRYNRSYPHGSTEYDTRRSLFQERVTRMEVQNRKEGRLWTAGPNRFWDWTEDETMSLRGYDGSVRPDKASRGIRRHSVAFLQQQSELPEEKLWTHLSMAKNVRNQGDCGSCWAIATATVLEGHAEIFTGKPRTFSAQQIVMCTPNPRHCGGDGGCQGATAELAFDWVMKHGCAEESQDPYTGQQSTCSMGSTPALTLAQTSTDTTALSGAAAFGMNGWETLPKNQYEPLVRALAERGPVAVSVAAGGWFDYDSGVFNACSKDAVIDHAVTAIGYGSDGANKFWLIQNSWGADWGEEGHIRLQRHDVDEYCGTNNDPQKGVACKGDNAAVPVCGMCGILFDSVVPHFR